MESAAQEKLPAKTEPSWDSMSVKDEPSSPVFIKDEPPSDGSAEPSFLNVFIKDEILNTEASYSNASETPLDVTVKVERVKEECGVSARAAAEGLYAGHAVTGELVHGPTLVERREATSTDKVPSEPHVHQRPTMEAVSVKTEPPYDGAAQDPPTTHAEEVGTSLVAPMCAEAVDMCPEAALHVKQEGALVKLEVVDLRGIVDMMQVFVPQMHGDDAMVVKKEPNEDASKPHPHNVMTEDIHVELDIEFEIPGAGGSGTAHTSERETQLATPEPHLVTPEPRESLVVREPPPKRRRRATSAPLHACGECHRTFKCPIGLEQHMKTHSGEEPFACDRCDWRYAQLNDLKRHYGTHRAKWKTFYKKLIQLGVATNGGVARTHRYSCGTCELSFSEQSDLKTHEGMHSLVHREEKPYPCKMCDERFSEQNGLLEHERLHTGEKPYSCPTCHKKFVRLMHFKNHEYVHTGEKPYACDTCHKKFTQQSTLKRHQLTHTHVCLICGKGYTRANDLKRHERTHTTSPSV